MCSTASHLAGRRPPGALLGLPPGVMRVETLKVWYDFLCPFARIGVFWLRNVEAAGGLDHEIEWKTFSLEQVNLPEEGDVDQLWATADERRSLLPSAAAKWAETQGGDVFAAVQRTFFDGRHVDHEKIGRPEVTAALLSKAGSDGDTVIDQLRSDRKWLDAARADHEEGAALGVFGVPTLVFPGAQPVFLRLLEIPEGDRAVDIYRRVKENALDPLIHEFKRPTGAR